MVEIPTGQITYVTAEDRVVFKRGFQRKLLELARGKLKYTNWGSFAKDILQVSKRMVFNYLNESSKLSLPKARYLSETINIPMTNVLRIIKKEDILSEQGRLGGKKVIPLLQKYNLLRKKQKIEKKTIKKLSREELNEVAKKNLMKRDKRVSSIRSLLSQKPTPQERKIIEENISNNLQFNFQKILEKGKEWRCFDFIYFLNSKLILAEEATNTNYPHKGQILDFIEKGKWLKEKFNIPLIITFSDMPKRFDMLLLLIDENIIPVSNHDDRIKIINSYLNNESDVITDYVKELKTSIRERINESSKRLLATAKRESSIMNSLEKIAHEKLVTLGLSPLGKKIFQTIYGTYLVSDNYFELNEQKFCVLISSAKSHNSLRILASEHAAYAYFIKRLVNPKIKCVSVFDYNEEFDFLNNSNSLNRKYLQKYLDIILNFKEINKLPLILKEKRLAC